MAGPEPDCGQLTGLSVEVVDRRPDFLFCRRFLFRGTTARTRRRGVRAWTGTGTGARCATLRFARPTRLATCVTRLARRCATVRCRFVVGIRVGVSAHGL